MNDAELLLEIAETVLYPRDLVMLVEDADPSTCDTVALALRLRERKDLALRAMIENWNRFRIVRELY